jgi:very-short-patch-repair endonuclease
MRGTNPTKTSRARRLRRSSTDAERRLWYRIRPRALAGHKFVHQEPIGRYVVDFVCRERRLIIELDGGQHATNERDVVREQWLTAQHYRVLRFWNNDVMGNIEGAGGDRDSAGHGGCRKFPECGSSPSPGSLTRSDLSPQAGRGGARGTFGAASGRC